MPELSSPSAEQATEELIQCGGSAGVKVLPRQLSHVSLLTFLRLHLKDGLVAEDSSEMSTGG